MQLMSLLLEDEDSLLDRFPIKIGPFNSKNDVYRWFKQHLGNKSLYFGKGLQRNVLKGGGGGQVAWYGFMRRGDDGIFFFTDRKYPYDPPQTKAARTDPYEPQVTPVSLGEFQKWVADGIDEDRIVAYAIERGITQKLARFIANDKSVSEIIKLELAEYFELPQSEPQNVKAVAPEKKPVELHIGRYGVDIDDFTAAVMDKYGDEQLADIFGIRPSQAQSLRLSLGMKMKGGRTRQFDYDEIERLHKSGLGDEEIASRIGATVGTVSRVTAPLRLDAVEDGIKRQMTPMAIANMVKLPLKIVMRLINDYKARIANRPWCKTHKISYNEKFGCPHCREA